MAERNGKIKIVRRGDERDHGKNGAIGPHVAQAFLEAGLALLFFFRGADRAGGNEASAIISATKETALQKKAEAAPHHPTNKPASEGPTSREP